MGARHGDALAQAHQLGQHHRARHHRYPARPRGQHFRIIRPHGGGHHHRIGIGQMLFRVADIYRCAQFLEAFRGDAVAEIGTAHLIAKIEQHLGDAAHAGAADANEVQMFNFMFHFFLFGRDASQRFSYPKGESRPYPGQFGAHSGDN